MLNSCKNARIVSPSGVWEYEQLIGAKVKVKSMPISNFFGCFSGVNELLTIKDIFFRISLDGKTITVIELVEYPGKIFTWKDLEVVELNIVSKFKSACGEFLAGQTVCGHGVDTNPSWLNNVNGIAIIDENGNVITNRIVRIVGATVEDITKDVDDISDIDVNFNGDILDKK